MTTETRIGMPLNEFMVKFDAAPFELIDGEEKSLMPTMFEHSEVIRILWTLLVLYQQAHPDIRVYSETTFVLTALPDWVKGSRVPDLSIYISERLSAYIEATPDYRDKPLALVPDLALTLVAARAKYDDVNAKVERYLADGVRVVWVISPRAQIVMIYTQGSNQITRLTAADTLTGGDLLPDFAAPISALLM